MTEILDHQTSINIDAALLMDVTKVIQEATRFPRTRKALEKMVEANSLDGFTEIVGKMKSNSPEIRSFFIELAGKESTEKFARVALEKYSNLKRAFVISGTLKLAVELYDDFKIPVAAIGNSFNNVKDGNFEKISWLVSKIDRKIGKMAKQYILSSGIISGKSLEEINKVCEIEERLVNKAFEQSIKYQHREIFDIAYDEKKIEPKMIVKSCGYEDKYYFNRLVGDSNKKKLKTALATLVRYGEVESMKNLLSVHTPKNLQLYFIHAVESGNVEKLQILQRIDKGDYPLMEVLRLFMNEDNKEKYQEMFDYLS